MKTLGAVSANLISSLYKLNKTIFKLQDIEAITGLKENAASDLAGKLIKRNIISRLKQGKYIIIPQEIGKDSKYIGNWYVAAREIVNSPDYYISYYSAMDMHNMVTHPVTKVFVNTPKQEYKKQKIAGGVIFEFIYISSKNLWGIKNFWVTKSEQVKVSDIERTIIDCLYRPQYCGGILEIAKGLWMQKQKIDFDRLFSYAVRFDRIVVIKRLGYILESLGLKDACYLNKLKSKINNKYYTLDPLLNAVETYKNLWKCIANISPQEIKQAVNS
jgi:predicted transcriptional regulator of viral defense system